MPFSHMGILDRSTVDGLWNWDAWDDQEMMKMAVVRDPNSHKIMVSRSFLRRLDDNDQKTREGKATDKIMNFILTVLRHSDIASDFG